MFTKLIEQLNQELLVAAKDGKAAEVVRKINNGANVEIEDVVSPKVDAKYLNPKRF